MIAYRKKGYSKLVLIVKLVCKKTYQKLIRRERWALIKPYKWIKNFFEHIYSSYFSEFKDKKEINSLKPHARRLHLPAGEPSEECDIIKWNFHKRLQRELLSNKSLLGSMDLTSLSLTFCHRHLFTYLWMKSFQQTSSYDAWAEPKQMST